MFKNKTFSTILNIKINEEKMTYDKKQAKEKAIKEDKQKRILDLVRLQYEKAQEIIGKRFTFRQQHDTMFYFTFCGKNTFYQCKIYSHELEPEGDFEFRDYSFSPVYHSKLKLLDYKIKLYKLTDNLIEWAKFVLEEELHSLERK